MNEPMSQTRRALGLRAYLNLALAVTIVIFTLASAFTYTQVESRIRSDVEEHLDSLAAHSAGDTIATWLEQKRSLAKALATYPAMRGMQVEEAQRIINATYAAAPTDYNNIGFFDATGLMVADIAGATGTGNLIKGNPWGQEVYDGRRTQSPELISSLNNRPIFVLYERVMDASGAVVGVVGVGTNLTAISERLEEQKIGQTGEAVLVNSQGVVLNRLRHKPDSVLTLDLSKDRLTQLALSGKAGIVEMSDYRGVPVVAAYRPLPEYGWGVVVKQDADEAFAVLARLRAVFFGVIVSALTVALVSNLIVQRRVSRALGRLIAGSQRFAAGELATPIEPLAIGEFGHLADEFNRMAAALSDKETRLRGYAQELEQRVQERTADLLAANTALSEEIAERTRAEAEILRRNRELSALYTISRAAARSLDLGQTLDNALEATLEALESEMGGILILEPDGQTMTLRAHRGLSEEFVRAVQRIKLGEGTAGKAAAEKKPIILDISEYPTARLAPFFVREGIQTTASAPLLSAGEVVGSLSLATRRGRAFPPEELGLLSAVGQQLGSAVRNAQLYQTVQHELAERKRAEEAIKKLNADLERRAAELEVANKELEAFSYSVSHDLRAPLRAVDGFSRILLDEHAPQLAPEAQRYLQLVRDNTLQMGRLIDDLLTFARLSRQPLQKQAVAPVDLMRQCLQELRAEQEGRRIEISIGDLPACQADPALLKQVWINLLANALKFTRKREVARIEIGSWKLEDGNWKLENATPTSNLQPPTSNLQSPIYYVRDNGVGFDMRYADKLFGVFQRLHRASEYEGTGVGLAIVQRIIHRHGGRVWAEAQVDQGATFYFTI